MDFRTPRPAERTTLSRPRPAQRPADEPQPAKEAPKTAYRSAGGTDHSTKQTKSKRFVLPIIIIVAVIVLGAGGWFAWSNMQRGAAGIDGGKYQAVFFDNGQVYFGKLHVLNGEYMKLTDIYYLQTPAAKQDDSQNPQKTTADQSNVQLIKLGDEIHGPQDEMIISKNKVLFYENLKSDGKVTQSIQKFKNAH